MMDIIKPKEFVIEIPKGSGKYVKVEMLSKTSDMQPVTVRIPFTIRLLSSEIFAEHEKLRDFIEAKIRRAMRSYLNATAQRRKSRGRPE